MTAMARAPLYGPLVMDALDGIGGTFLFSEDPARLAAWYHTHLGFQFKTMGDTHYQMFITRDAQDVERRIDFHFGIMKAKVPMPPRPAPTPEPTDADAMYGDQPFMLNVRVRSLDEALAHLASHGVTPIRRDDYAYGKFAHIRDADGHRVELYEPVPGAFDDELDEPAS